MTSVAVLALIACTIASARLTRLIVHDRYPPAAWLRIQWDKLTHDGPWSELVHCNYCAAPYCSAALWWPLYATMHWPFGWYIAALVWFGMAYLAAIIVSYDGG